MPQTTNDDFSLMRSPRYSTRIEACEAILAKYGFVHGLYKEIPEVHLAIRAHDPEHPRPSEEARFAKAVKMMKALVGTREVVDFSTYTQAQLDEALLQACKAPDTVPNRSLLALLLDLGADHRTEDTHGCTAFFHALGPYSFPVLQLFIEHGADINTEYRHRSMPIHDSVWLRCVGWAEPDTVRFMLEQGADVDAQNSMGHNALHSHCRTRADPAVVQALLEAGAQIDAADAIGQTPLIVLCRSHIDKVDTANVLVSAGADPRIADHAQKTALHFAAFAYRATRGLTDLLVEAGASPDAGDADGNTPLHVAVLRDNKAVVIALLEHGVTLGTKNGAGKSALELAIEKGYLPIGRLLDARAEQLYREHPDYARLIDVKAQIIAGLQAGMTLHQGDKEGSTTFSFEDGAYVVRRYDRGRTPPETHAIPDEEAALAWLYEKYRYDSWSNQTERSLYEGILKRLQHR